MEQEAIVLYTDTWWCYGQYRWIRDEKFLPAIGIWHIHYPRFNSRNLRVLPTAQVYAQPKPHTNLEPTPYAGNRSGIQDQSPSTPGHITSVLPIWGSPTPQELILTNQLNTYTAITMDRTLIFGRPLAACNHFESTIDKQTNTKQRFIETVVVSLWPVSILYPKFSYFWI